MEIKINVKNESAFDFMTQRMTGVDPQERIMPHYLFKDEIYFDKHKSGVNPGDYISIEMESREELTKKDIINIYIYLAHQYDDISVRLTLEDFKVKLK